MPTLTERIDVRLASLQAERARIEAQVADDLAGVDQKLAALAKAKAALTKDVEQAYALLLAMGLIKDVEER